VALMRMSYEEWDEWTRGSAIRRAGYAGFRRNVAVALGNWLASMDESPEEAVAVLREALDNPEPLVREHAAWALGRVDSAGARSALASRAAVESDQSVRLELASTLGA
jgi:epoxyqueuosine reductase